MSDPYAGLGVATDPYAGLGVTNAEVAPPIAAPANPWSGEPVSALKGNMVRNMMEGVGGLADFALAAPKAIMGHAGLGQMNYGQMSELAKRGADWAGFPTDEQASGPYVGAATRAAAGTLGIGGPAAIGAAATGGLAAEAARQGGAPWWAQAMAGVAGGLGFGGVAGAARTAGNFTRDSTAINMMLGSGRAKALEEGTAEAVQGAVKASRAVVKAPFTARYRAAEAAQPTFQRSPSMAAVPEWAMAQEQPQQLQRIQMNVTGRVLKLSENQVIGEPAVRGALTDTAAIDTGTVRGLKDARSIILSRARAQGRAGNDNAARVLNNIGEAMQRDMDNNLMSMMGRQISRDYRAKVIQPFKRVAARGALTPEADAEQAWNQIRLAKPSANKKLSDAVMPEARDVIRKRVVAAIIRKEDQYALGSGGSGAPTYRQLDDHGLGAFFTKDEWHGIGVLASKQATWRNSILRTGGRVVATMIGGKAGGAGAAAAGYLSERAGEYIATSTPGRLFLARLRYQTPQQMQAAFRDIIESPALIAAIDESE